MDSIVLPRLPYRGLYSFRYVDREIFAGRDTEIEKVYKLLLLFRGTLVYGPTGIGKSSLIAAGVIPKLSGPLFTPEIIRLNPNDKGSFVISRIKSTDYENSFLPSTFDSFLKDDDKDAKKINVSFEDFKKTIGSLKLERQKKIVSFEEQENEAQSQIKVLIFDQFEELITLFEDHHHNENTAAGQVSYSERIELQEKIIDFLTSCYFTEVLPIKLIFVFREDYLASFGKLFNSIPDLKDHYIRIKPLPTSKLSEIITRPFIQDEKHVHFKQPFSEKLISEIETKFNSHYPDEKLHLTEVQIICLQVYLLADEEKRLQLFKGDKAIQNILENFYLGLLNKLSEKERPVAIDILSLLVLDEKTRNIYHEDAILDALEHLDPNMVKKVVDTLETQIRIIRRESRPGGNYYEIVSEAIIPYINRKKIEKEKEIKGRKEQRRKLWLGLAILFPILTALTLILYQVYKENKIASIINKERVWFEKIPEQSYRDKISDILYDNRNGADSTMKNSLQLAAQSYNADDYSNSLAIAYMAYKYDANEVTAQMLNSWQNKFNIPYRIRTHNGNLTPFLPPSSNTIYFFLSDNQTVQIKDLNDSSYSDTNKEFVLFSDFKTTVTSWEYGEAKVEYDSPTGGRSNAIVTDLGKEYIAAFSPDKNNIVFTSDFIQFVNFNIPTRTQRFLFTTRDFNTPGEQTGLIDNEKKSALFVNDSIFALFSKSEILLYNLSNPHVLTLMELSGIEDKLLSRALTSWISSEYKNMVLETKSQFKQVNLKAEIEGAYKRNDYDTVIRTAQDLLKVTKQQSDSIYAYWYLAQSYYYKDLDLPLAPENLNRQMEYTRARVKSWEQLVNLAPQSQEYTNGLISSLSSLSYYLVVNKKYQEALESVLRAKQLDASGKQQWLKTNLALSYLFSGQQDKAFEIYRQYKNQVLTGYNSKVGKELFKQDIDDLESIYKISIPRRNEIMRILAD